MHDILGLEVRECALLAGMDATEEGCYAPGSVQMQACDHEGVSSCERDPHGDSVGHFGSGGMVFNILCCLSDGVRAEVTEATIT